jgi:hypothetical protein
MFFWVLLAGLDLGVIQRDVKGPRKDSLSVVHRNIRQCAQDRGLEVGLRNFFNSVKFSEQTIASLIAKS